MSERKVLTKYYPPDFDPSAIAKKRGKKQEGPKLQTVRLMSPMNMKCLRCGEFIYKGRKFNARKEKPDGANYLGIQIYRFYIRCTRCSGEIIFQTDPKNQDYALVSGAKRNVEPWRSTIEETDEQRLDRLEAEQAAADGEQVAEQNRMEELEAKTLEAKREMDVADALDEIRTRNARIARADHREALEAAVLARPSTEDELRRQQDEEDAEVARAAFAAARRAAAGEPDPIEIAGAEAGDGAEAESEQSETSTKATSASPAPSKPATATTLAGTKRPAEDEPDEIDLLAGKSFKIQARKPKKKTDFASKLGIKIKK